MSMAINPIQQGMNLDIAISFFLRAADGPADEVELFFVIATNGVTGIGKTAPQILSIYR
jgi:hypothetical protein